MKPASVLADHNLVDAVINALIDRFQVFSDQQARQNWGRIAVPHYKSILSSINE